jgi:hypothetical protein
MTVIVNHDLYDLCCCYRHAARNSLTILVSNYTTAKAATHHAFNYKRNPFTGGIVRCLYR